jgi:putative exosortase-associated protein (TIGR04073 family)
MSRSRGAALAGALVLSLFLTRASRAETAVMGDPESTVVLASTKLWRGLVNTATGLGELFRQPVVCSQKEGPTSIPVGIINGLFMSVVRTGAGLVEVVTFPVPLDSTIGYRSLMTPEYVWEAASSK